jgi:hypothetical protein
MKELRMLTEYEAGWALRMSGNCGEEVSSFIDGNGTKTVHAMA